jgi:hypothetical protein
VAVAVVVAVVVAVIALISSFKVKIIALKMAYYLLGQILEKIPNFHLDC